jgi:hypothetical protein
MQRDYLMQFTGLSGERLIVNAYVILTMPLREGALPGRTHTASCTLCRDRLVAAGERDLRTAGALGFFRSQEHRDLFVQVHADKHEADGDMVHIINLPDRLTNSEESKNGGEGLSGDRSTADRATSQPGETAPDPGLRAVQEG